MDAIENGFEHVVRFAVIGLEAIGAVLILWFAVRSVIAVCKRNLKGSRHEMTKGITTGLSFMLGSEVLKTLIAPDWTDIGMTCAILLMRAGITVLVHWENTHETDE